MLAGCPLIMSRCNNILLTIVIAYVALSLASCAKKQTPDTPFTKLMGKWKLTQFASGTGNSALIYSPLDKAEDWEWIFNETSKGYDIESWNGMEGIRDDFSFKIVGADSLWKASEKHDTTMYYIQEINSVDMIWTKTYKLANGNVTTEGYYFTKYK